VTRKIGEGIQYRAFETRELEDGKVLKQPLPKSEMYRKFMWRNKLEPWRLRKARSEVQRLDESREHARDLVEDLDYDARSHLGDPKYTGELKYTQTKVSPSDRGPIDINDIEQIAQDYANIQRELWKHGCHDPVFHFLSATGYDDNGHMILMDFHELIDDRERAEEDTDNKKWKDQWDYIWGLRQQYVSDYVDFGDTTLLDAYLTRIGFRTPERLESWRSKCGSVFDEVLGSRDVGDLWKSSL
jgi:hypothetical protein